MWAGKEVPIGCLATLCVACAQGTHGIGTGEGKGMPVEVVLLTINVRGEILMDHFIDRTLSEGERWWRVK